MLPSRDNCCWPRVIQTTIRLVTTRPGTSSTVTACRMDGASPPRPEPVFARPMRPIDLVSAAIRHYARRNRRTSNSAVDRRFGEAHVSAAQRISQRHRRLDRIRIRPDGSFDAGRNLNVAKARVTGIDASYHWHSPLWELTVSALLQDPEDLQTGEQLARRAGRSLTVNAVRQVQSPQYRPGPARHVEPPRLGVRRHNQRRLPAGQPDRPVAGFRPLVRAGQIENLLDRDYETAAGFRSPGRGLYLTALYRSQ